MRVLVTGSRRWRDQSTVAEAILGHVRRSGADRAVLVFGDATGADAIALELARCWDWPYERHIARWKDNPVGAGDERDAAMVGRGADLCLAFALTCARARCDGKPVHLTHGTDECVRRARWAGIPTVVVEEPR